MSEGADATRFEYALSMMLQVALTLAGDDDMLASGLSSFWSPLLWAFADSQKPESSLPPPVSELTAVVDVGIELEPPPAADVGALLEDALDELPHAAAPSASATAHATTTDLFTNPICPAPLSCLGRAYSVIRSPSHQV